MHITSRRRLAATVAAIALASGPAACSGGADAATGDTISIGVGIDGTYAAFFVADAEGLFRKQGVNVKVVQFSAGGDAVQAIAGKQVQLAGSSTTTAVTLMAQNSNLRGLFPYMKSDTYLKVVANPKVKTATDIKSIGVVPGVSEYLAHKYFESEGVDAGGVKFVKADPPELPALTAKGDLDAFLLWEPWPTNGAAMGLHVLTDTGQFGQPTTQILLGEDNWITGHEDDVVKIAKALNEASTKIEADPEAAAKTVSKGTKISDATALNEIKQVDYGAHAFTTDDMKSFSEQSAYFVKAGTLKSVPDLSTTILQSWYADHVK